MNSPAKASTYPDARSWSGGMIAAYACISLALGLVVGLGIWGAYRDLQLIRNTALQVEMNRLRTQAVRTVGRIERSLEQYPQPELRRLRDEAWLPTYWHNVLPENGQPHYAAIVDTSDHVILHSNSELQDRPLPRTWYDRIVREAGTNVFETHTPLLGEGTANYVLRIPIEVHQQVLGDYLIGMDVAAFERLVASHRQAILRRWGLIMGAIVAIVLLASVSLYYIASRTLALRSHLSDQQWQRSAELSQLAAGLAHEIRNPLHAIRLNLHALGRALGGRSRLQPDDVLSISEQSNQEIDRVDRLLKELLSFASPAAPQLESLDVCDEVAAVVDFLRQEMQRKQIALQVHAANCPACIEMDRSRLRQVLMNLLTRAEETVAVGGEIAIDIEHTAGRVVVGVRDDGQGVAASDRPRMFEPFFAPTEDGTGLGLALVKRFVEEARGQVSCEPNQPRGTRFRLEFPAVPSSV